MNGRGTLRRFHAACAIAREAGLLARQHFERGVSLTFKGHQDHLTEADGAVEKLVMARIAAAFPDDTCLGEEGGGRISDRLWVIDPIDGTANFARAIPLFCVSIAFVREGKATIGVIYDPMNDELFAARTGAGAFVNGRKMQVSATSDIRQAMVELGWSTRCPWADYLSMLTRVVATGAGFRRTGSGALGLAYVAAGRSDGYAELHINSWDALAALVMVREAGGWTNDFLAGEALTKGNPVLATNPALAEELRRATGINS